MVTRYVPRAGDIIWIDFDPQAGREQAKRRPALVVTDRSYNRASGLVIVCPLAVEESLIHLLCRFWLIKSRVRCWWIM